MNENKQTFVMIATISFALILFMLCRAYLAMLTHKEKMLAIEHGAKLEKEQESK